MLNWYSETVEETARRNATDIQTGLSPEKTARRIERHGKNITRELEHKSFSTLLFAQIKDFTFVLLLFAAVISLVIAVNRDNGNWLESLIVLIICTIYAVIGALRDKWVQDERERLRSLTVPQVTVIRGGMRMQISVEDMVKGDIFFVCKGDRIPADGRLVSSADLVCCETEIGCLAVAEKNADVLLDVTAPLAERCNMIFRGTSVLNGTGCAIAVAVGMQTEAGIRSGIYAGTVVQDNAPLLKDTNELQKPIIVSAVIICALIFIIGFSFRYPYGIDAIESLLTALAFAVTVIPELLASLFTLAKIAGARRMAEKHAVARTLPVMERLAEVTVICADKTGIITTDSMEPAKLWTAEGHLYPVVDANLSGDALKLLEYSAICISSAAEAAELSAPGQTDASVLPTLEQFGIRKKHLDLRFPCERVIPFDRAARMSSTLHRVGSGSLIICKGAPEAILPLCDGVDREMVETVIAQFGGDLLRVIAVASRELSSAPENIPDEAFHAHFSLVGLIGLSDPLRERTKESAEICTRAGIRVVMTTGDHPATAAAAAAACGIMRDGDEMLTGDQLAAMTDDELSSGLRKYSVYARITPSDKLRIIRAWQKHGEVVAVTGLSVDDVPALEAADVGLTSRESDSSAQMISDAVMLEGSLVSAAGAVREGRTVCANIRNAARYMLQGDIAIALMMIPGMMICGTFPLLSLHILTASLIAAVLCSIAICCEPSFGESMTAPFLQQNRKIFSPASAAMAICSGAVSAILMLAAFFIGRRNPAGEPLDIRGRTMAFGVMMLITAVGALAARMPVNGFRPGIRHNQVMMQAGAVTCILLLVSLLLLKMPLMLSALTFGQWCIMLLLGAFPMIATEAIRLLREMRSAGSIKALFK